jgi:poly(A) polymerase/tRNA nucleotidyltransferase (CCA-adding enzyme)
MSALAPLPFIRALQQHQARVYTVGGTVRDELLGKPGKDVDLLVTGLPQPLLIRLLRQYGRVQLTGRAFGVIKFLPRQWNGPPIDIALPRTEISTGIGHRDFEVVFDHTLPIETDLGRRDFTLNALAIDLATGCLIDPFGGRQDLEQRLLRQVSDRAFPEDPLRMLRGVQLAARFRLRLETATRQAMQAHAAAITTVAPERIAEELRKLFQATSPARGFVLMYEVGLLPHVLPEVAALVGVGKQISDAFTRTMRRLDAVQQREELAYRGHLDLLLAALFQDVGLAEATQIATEPMRRAHTAAHQARQRLEALKMTMLGARLDFIETLIQQSALAIETLASDAARRHFTSHVGVEAALMLFELWLADQLANTPDQPAADILSLRQRLRDDIDHHVPFRVTELAINGHDLLRLGIPPSPRLGQLLQHLLQQVLDDPTRNTRDRLLALAQRQIATQEEE